MNGEIKVMAVTTTGSGRVLPKCLFLFMDGVGLGGNDPQINPFARAHMPTLERLLGGKRLLADSAPLKSQRATLLALDACLGIGGRVLPGGLPQSATGQAALLTGQNVPAILGYHYGPKPNPEVAAFLKNGTLFSQLSRAGRRVAFLNAYPPGYFQGISSGRRLYSAIPLAAISAGLTLHNAADLNAGQAISADFTAQGWRQRLGLPETPVYTPYEAGQRLARLSLEFDFAFFEYWLSDYAGHEQNMEGASALLESFDQTLAGLVQAWDDAAGLVLITSDHGNLEDLSTRRHTANPVPALLIGAPDLRRAFAASLRQSTAERQGTAGSDLTGVAPAICQLLNVDCGRVLPES